MKAGLYILLLIIIQKFNRFCKISWNFFVRFDSLHLFKNLLSFLSTFGFVFQLELFLSLIRSVVEALLRSAIVFRSVSLCYKRSACFIVCFLLWQLSVNQGRYVWRISCNC